MFVPFKLALKALYKNPVRTGLTTLGIVIGVASVILVMSAGAGFQGFVQGLMDSFGTNTIFVETRVPQATKKQGDSNVSMTSDMDRAMSSVVITSLKLRDVEDVKRIHNVENAYGAVFGQKVVSYGGTIKNAMIFGSSQSRFDIDKTKLVSGRPFSALEDAGSSQVAILGNRLAKDLFGENDPVGKLVKVGELNFEVIGVYEEKGSFSGMNEDKMVFIPVNTAQKKLLGIDYLVMIVIQAKDPSIIEATAEDIRLLLRRNHQISDPSKDDFGVFTQEEGMAIFDQIFSGITLLLISIAAISLVVGGVGIMNIMYVIVTERTNEIGLKKALGAKNKEILSEFLIGAVLITLTGGLVGMVMGSLASFGLSLYAKTYLSGWVFTVPFSAVALAVGVSVSIGLIFGVLPAKRASKLDPIEALRYE
jgi:putative ABC transport system permease protein